MIKLINTNSKYFSNQLNNSLNSRKSGSSLKLGIVKKIIMDVKKNKDSAVIKYEKN